jgi:ketosteroid isomerase-like protein
MKTILVVLSFVTLAVASSQHPTKPASKTEELTVRAADEAWAQAIGSKSVEDTVRVYDEEAMTAGSAMPPARGVSAIRAMWTGLFAQPGFSLTWKAEGITVTQSGTMAISTGTWRTPEGSGPYIAVWRKQRDGTWKVLFDSAWYAGKPQ